MAKYHGQRGRVYLSTSGAGTAVQAVALTSWSLNLPTDRVEVTSFEDTNKVYVQGKKDITGDFSGFWDEADDSLFDAADSSTPVKLYLYPSADASTRYFYGTAWVDASIEVGVDAAVSISGSFAAATAWGRMP
jgi:hypothetical protein